MGVCAKSAMIAWHSLRSSKSEGFMRADLLPLGFLVTPSLAHGQVTIDVSKVTCDQFAQARVGDPRTTAVWLNGYYNGKTGSTTVDTQESEAIFAKLMNFCRSEDNG